MAVCLPVAESVSVTLLTGAPVSVSMEIFGVLALDGREAAEHLLAVRAHEYGLARTVDEPSPSRGG